MPLVLKVSFSRYLVTLLRILQSKCGSIIAIYTKAGKGILGSEKPKGFVKTTVPVFSASREFYAPKYKNLQNDDWNRPDLRALIDWKPVLKTDSLGIATISFYNTDIGGEVMVVVEAITDNGEIGYKEMEYKVEGDGKEIIIIDK